MTTATFPYTKPDLRITTWDEEFCTPIDLNGITVLDDELKGCKSRSVPMLSFTGTLIQEIMYLVRKNPSTELAMFLTLKRLSNSRPHWLAFDMVLPGQTATGSHVSLDGPDCDRYFTDLAKVPYYAENGLHRNLCHLHSHGAFDTQWSPVDDEQQFSRDGLGFADDYRFYVVVNAKGSIKASFVTYRPVLQRIDAAVSMYPWRPEYIIPLSKERKEALDAQFDGVFKKSPAMSGPGLFGCSPASIGFHSHEVGKVATTSDKFAGTGLLTAFTSKEFQKGARTKIAPLPKDIEQKFMDEVREPVTYFGTQADEALRIFRCLAAVYGGEACTLESLYLFANLIPALQFIYGHRQLLDKVVVDWVDTTQTWFENCDVDFELFHNIIILALDEPIDVFSLREAFDCAFIEEPNN